MKHHTWLKQVRKCRGNTGRPCFISPNKPMFGFLRIYRAKSTNQVRLMFFVFTLSFNQEIYFEFCLLSHDCVGCLTCFLSGWSSNRACLWVDCNMFREFESNIMINIHFKSYFASTANIAPTGWAAITIIFIVQPHITELCNIMRWCNMMKDHCRMVFRSGMSVASASINTSRCVCVFVPPLPLHDLNFTALGPHPSA